MLKYIKVKNFLSFRDETIIDFTSDLYGNLKNNVIKEKDTTLNKSLIIY
jgi:AAA15 family ATPase/GTPase